MAISEALQQLRALGRRASVVGSYSALAFVATLPMWWHGAGDHLPACPGNCSEDPSQAAWFLGLTAHALEHLQNPFFTGLVNAPNGVNLMGNTSIVPFGFLMTPITTIWGPVASFNAIVVVAIAASASAAYLAIRRWVEWRPAAYAGGLLYGFSPYMTAHQVHPHLLFAAYPPLVLLVLDEIFIRQRGRPYRWGLVLGIMSVVQFLVSPEVLAETVLVAMVVTAFLAAVRWSEVATRLRYAALSLGTAAGSAGVLLAYPLWMMLSGPQHLSGPVQPPSAVSYIASDLLGPLVPTTNQLFHPAALAASSGFSLSLAPDENGVYLGIPLVLMMIYVAVRLWRLMMVRVAAVIAVVGFVLSLGSHLAVNGSTSSIPLPFDLVAHAPLLDNSVAARYSVFVYLASALLLAIAVECIRAWAAKKNRRWSLVLPGGLVVATFLPVMPSVPYAASQVEVPAFFTSDYRQFVPLNGTLLTYPFIQWPLIQPMVWQAEDDFRYRVPGGYVYTPGPGGEAVTHTGTPSFTSSALKECASGAAAVNPSPDSVTSVRLDLQTWDVTTVVVTSQAPDPQCAVALFSGVFGHRPRRVDDVWVWSSSA